MPKQPGSVVLIDDSKVLCKLLEMHLSNNGFLVSGQANTFKEALDLVSDLAGRQGERIVAIVGGNLTKGWIDNQDGVEIAKALREQVAGVRIVGYSATASRDFEALCHVFVLKHPSSEREIVEACQRLAD